MGAAPRAFIRQISNAEDRKHDVTGSWIKSWSATENGERRQYQTRASLLWKVVEAKCTPGSYAQKVRPKYSLASNAFSDFQDFAEWAQSAAGYLSKDENGRFWHLDKDILVKGNHVYGKDTCCFIPARVNTLLLTSRFSDSTLPLGVHFSVNAQRFRAQTHIDKKDTMLGYFDSPEEAHSAWQRVKIDEILKVCRWYEELNGSSKNVVNALVCRVEQVRDDMLSGRITNSL